MMQRRHRKTSFPSEMETQHLQNDRERFEHEDTSDDRKQQFLFTTNRHHSDRATDRERAGVAHENSCRMTVEPKKTKTSANERRAKDRQFARVSIEWHLQVLRDTKVARRISEQGIGKRNRNRATYRKPVESISEIDGVGGADYHEREKEKGERAHVHDHGEFEKREIKRARLHFDQRIEQEKNG